MKNVIAICLLLASIFVGGMTMDAKTTKKKKKARTTQTSSNALWNGDMPTASLIVNNMGKWDEEFPKMGYIMTDGEAGHAWYKNGVCKVEHWAVLVEHKPL